MSFASSWLTRGRSVALAAVLLAAGAVAPLSVSAHFLNYPNHRWQFTNGTQQLLNLWYSRDCATDWWTPDTAANAWTATWTPLDLHQEYSAGCSGAALAYIKVLDGTQTGSADGWTENYHFSCISTPFGIVACSLDYNLGQPSDINASLIYENHYNSNYDNLTGGERADIIKHEMGHAMGLAHAGYYGGETPDMRGYPYGVYSIMDYCCPSDYTAAPWNVPTTPTAHDTSDINQLYPSNYW